MKKFRLIKTYPGSPELGIICEERNNKSSFCYYYEGEKNLAIQKDQVENQPEYWEKIEEDTIWGVVFEQEHIQDDKVYFKSWTPCKIECIPNVLATHRYLFKTKERAEYFILTNKPCLSYNDVSNFAINFDETGVYYKVYTEKLKEIIKSRL